MEITLLTSRSGYLSEIESVKVDYISKLMNRYTKEEQKSVFIKKDMIKNSYFIYRDNILVSLIKEPIFNLKSDIKTGELYYEIIIKIEEQ